ncbi:MAG: hypothetical protein PHY54_08910 [Methylococcales bacterium]|nr:hypothetical protein [Methylococcales bacterium]
MTTTLLSEPLIDLVELGRNCKSAAGRPFATAIALMADGVIRRYVGEDELLGIRACLRHQLRTLTWRSYAWCIPLGKYSYSDGTFELESRTYILPNSLLASVLKYREALDERGTGLGRIIFSELAVGLEWACWRSQCESDLETSRDTKLISSEELNSYVSWATTRHGNANAA